MPGPVFIVFIPHKTLAEIDPATGAMKLREALALWGGPPLAE